MVIEKEAARPWVLRAKKERLRPRIPASSGLEFRNLRKEKEKAMK